MGAVLWTARFWVEIEQLYAPALNWWLENLGTVFPAPWIHLTAPASPACYLDIAEDRATLRSAAASSDETFWSEELAAYSGPIAPSSRLPEIMSARGMPSGNVILRLAPPAGLRRSLAIPPTPKRFLRRVIANELSHQTPFTAQEVYFDYRVPPYAGHPGKGLELLLARRQIVDRAMTIADALGIRPARVILGDEVDETHSFDLLHDPELPRKIRWRPLAKAGLIVAALLLLVTVTIAETGRQDLLREAVTSKLARERNLAGQAAHLQGLIDASIGRRAYLPLLESEERPDLVLEELARVLPADTWVNHFSFDQGLVHIDGFSKSPDRLIVLLEGTPLFLNPRFTGPVTASSVAGVEQFEISFRVKTPEENLNGDS